MHPDQLFSPDPLTRRTARELYESVAALPLICPHGHVEARLFSDPAASFGSPADLFIIPDHYITRMLYSQGIPLESLGVPSVEGGPVEDDHRKIWSRFCENFHLFRGTPSGVWLKSELSQVFGIDESPSLANAGRLYDSIAEKLASPECKPRAMFERFNIEVLCTNEAATGPLEAHRAIRQSGWSGRILPTFRPDAVMTLDAPGWKAEIDDLSQASGVDVTDYPSYLQALEQRRDFFRSMGATATDHGVLVPETVDMDPAGAERLFQHALHRQATSEDSRRFTANMLMEMARMSVEDGLVMQIHPGALRNHNQPLFQRFGPNLGGDIPIRTEYTRNLQPLLNRFGNDARLTLVIFTLDESTYARELAPLAGHYPALKLGPPWWFHDSPNGMRRYFDQVMETAGLRNTAGFNDDTRAFCSIPARHDVWRRVSADWLAGLVVRHIVDLENARIMIQELAVGLAKRTYRL
jgi:glucuronate isomerase